MKEGDWVKLKKSTDGKRGTIRAFDGAGRHVFVFWTDGTFSRHELKDLEVAQ